MSPPRLSQRQKAGLAVALALLLWVPQGISSEDHTVVTGHSTFYNGDAYDPCLGSIAGIMRSRVMWFNDQVLVEHYPGRGTFIYVTEEGALDPRGRVLKSEGVFYDFVDPNGAHWHVEEAYMGDQGELTVGYNTDPLYNNQKPIASVRETSDKTYVWIVELAAHPIYDEFAGADAHTYYNFLTLIDTCKMHKGAQRVNASHDNASGLLNNRYGHENGAKEHEHQTWLVNLWVGPRPTVVLGGASTQGAQWETDWAASEAGEMQDDPEGAADQQSDGAYSDLTGAP